MESRREQKKYAWGITALALAAILLVPVLLSNIRTLKMQRERLATVTTQQRDMPDSSANVAGASLVAAQQTITVIGKPESNPLEILRKLSAELPDGILLTDFSYDRGRTVVLKGRATTNDVLASAMKTISGMEMVTHAMLDYSNLVKEGGGQGNDFQITCTLPATTDPTSTRAQGRTARTGQR